MNPEEQTEQQNTPTEATAKVKLLELGNPSFEAVQTSKGNWAPKVIFTTANETTVSYVGYRGGISVFMRRKGESKDTRIVHWGIQRNNNQQSTGRSGFGEPEYTLKYFRPVCPADYAGKPTKDEQVLQFAKDIADEIFKAVGAALDSETGVAFLADVASRPKVEVESKERSGFSIILGVMRNHHKCAQGADSPEAYVAKHAEAQARRAQSSEGTEIDAEEIQF